MQVSVQVCILMSQLLMNRTDADVIAVNQPTVSKH